MFESMGIADMGLIAGLGISLLAGILSFLSPCVLPIVPPYLAYMSGVSVSELNSQNRARRRDIFMTALFFVLGLSTVFLFLGFSFSYIGRALLQYQSQLTIIAGITVIVFGLHFLGVFRIPFLQREFRVESNSAETGSILGAYVLGLAFAFGWTPCLGPILSAILSLAASNADVGKGLLYLGGYALGLGVPFLLVALFLPRMSGMMAWFKRHMSAVEKTSGALLVIVGLLMVTGQFSVMSYWLLETFPFLGRIG